MDREALAAARDLSQEILSSLTQSQAMIVVCSPAAAGSMWVSKEITAFKALHPDAPVLAAIVSGDPNGASGQSACFPAALLKDGEPLAADFRKIADGPRLAQLKLVAGLTQIPLEDLLRREEHRRTRRVMAVTAGTSLIALVMSGLAITAVSASQLAQQRQREAEGMVDFMLGDLRDRLEPVGRLDALSGVAQKALDYYAGQDESKLDCDAAGRKATALQLAARVAIDAGDREASFDYAGASKRLTDRLIKTCVDDPPTLYNAAQAEFWAGEAQRRLWRSAGADAGAPELNLVRAHWLAYYNLSQTLYTLDPDNLDYRLELAFARSNLGTVDLNAGKAEAALAWFRLAEDDFRLIAAENPQDVEMQLEYADAISWTSTTLMHLARFEDSLDARQRHRELLVQLDQQAASPDWRVRRHIVTAHLRTIQTLIAMQDIGAARNGIATVRPLIEQLRDHDPENSDWQDAELFLAGHEQSLGALVRQNNQP
tara:strand:+ start:381 stop:1838 length:1458 start_codon:yes stop_codon:yes gene_type:complete